MQHEHDDLATAVGRGLAAGLAGTAVMTAYQTIQAKLGDGESSNTPAQAVETVLDVQPESERAEERLTQLTHWGYGTGWGVARGLLGAAGLHGAPATAAHLGLVWGSALAMLPALDLSPPATQWSKKQVAQDLLMHGLYAVATGVVYDWLASRDGREH